MDIIFIIFLLVVLAIGIVAAESDNWLFTTATMFSTFVALDLFFNVAVWSTIVSNPLAIILFTFIYVAIGAAYTAIWRWPVALRDMADNIQDSYDSYLKTHQGHSKEDFFNSSAYRSYSASANKGSLANWVLAWPLSLFWELARKPAIWIWNTAYDVLGKLFERIGKRVSSNILKDKQ